jgi:hypothetical protein
MFRFRVTVFIVALLALSAVLPVRAQEAEPLLETFTSDNGQVSFRYPGGWAADARSVPTESGGSITLAFLASTQQAATKIGLAPGTVLNNGEVLMAVTVGELGQMFGAASDIDAMAFLQTATNQSGQVYSPIVPITIADKPAARATRTTSGFDEIDLAVSYGGGIFSFIAVFTPPGQLAQWEPTVLAITESVFSGGVLSDAPQYASLSLGENVHYTATYPAGWSLRRIDPSTMTLGNSHNVLTKGLSSTFESGEVQVALVISPVRRTLDALGLQGGITILDVMNAVVAQAPTTLGVHFDTPAADSVANYSAARVTLNSPGLDGVNVFVDTDDGNIVTMQLLTARGELNNWLPTATDILNSVLSGEQVVLPTQAASTAALLTERATNREGTVAVGYPAAWFIRTSGDKNIYLANTEEALNYRFGDPVPSGSVQILILVSDAGTLLSEIGMNPATEAGPMELLQFAMENARQVEGMVFGTPETVTILGHTAARVHTSGNGFEGDDLLIEYPSRVMIGVQIISAPGELAQWQPTALAIAESVHYGQ